MFYCCLTSSGREKQKVEHQRHNSHCCYQAMYVPPLATSPSLLPPPLHLSPFKAGSALMLSRQFLPPGLSSYCHAPGWLLNYEHKTSIADILQVRPPAPDYHSHSPHDPRPYESDHLRVEFALDKIKNKTPMPKFRNYTNIFIISILVKSHVLSCS